MGFWVNISMTPNSVRKKVIYVQSIQFKSWCIPSVCWSLNYIFKKVNYFVYVHYYGFANIICIFKQIQLLPCKIWHTKANYLWLVDVLLVSPRVTIQLYFSRFVTKVSPIPCIVDLRKMRHFCVLWGKPLV